MTLKLSMRGVVKSFGTKTVLDHVDLDVAAGEVISLVGSSGSGKSTLLRCVNLLEPVDDGVIEFDGLDIAEPGLDPDPVRRRIGMVFQSFNLFPHMTVLRNVTLAPRKVLGRSADQAESVALHLLGRIGLADKAGEYPDRLSGGQQQRVAIVRAMAMEPELMLLDEITSALDPELVGEVLDMVRELRSTGMTMIIATHEMGFASEISDQICFLDAGRIIEKSDPEGFFTAPREGRTKAFLERVIDTGRL